MICRNTSTFTGSIPTWSSATGSISKPRTGLYRPAGASGIGKTSSDPGRIRTLEADLDGGGSVRPEATKRICFATPDIAGAGGSGGIGAAYFHLARLLAEQGHEVVIAYVNDRAAAGRLMEEVRARHAGHRIAVEPVVPRPVGEYVLDRDWAATWTLLDWLRARARPFDVVHTPDREAVGYGSLLAKSLGLSFGTTHFVVMGASPTLWRAEGDRRLVSTERELGWVFMERRSAELADTLVCTSGHLLEWMCAAGYGLPARTFVSPGPVLAPEEGPPDAGTAAPAAHATHASARLREVVFFGRLEWRKGLVLFLDAVDRLARHGRAPARVTFLGGVSEHLDGLERIRRRSRDWPAEVRTITDLGAEEAVAYLSQPGRLAVMPSLRESASMAVLECLRAGIPFLATAVGGTPELVAPEDHAHVLVPPDHVALGERIAALAGAPLHAARPRQDLDGTCEVWSRWHARTAPFKAASARFAERARAAAAEDPPVTVCIVHHERPALLRIAVDSVLTQDYPALEAVVVDDGSVGAEALAALAAVEAEFGARGWRVIRQENRFPGAARNAAAATARGEWLLFLDDDNALFPDAVSRLVRAARFSGADCLSAASIRFSGEGDPRTDTRSHGAPIRFLGASRTLNLIHNVAGDTCALVRRGAFETVGGFDEEYGLPLQDMDFCNRLIRAGLRIETLPDPVYWYRIQPVSMAIHMRDRRIAEASRSRVVLPYGEGLPADDRAFVGFATACIKHEMDALRQRLVDLDGELGARDIRIEALNRVVAERDGLTSDQNRRIGELHATVAERKRDILVLQETLTDQNRRIGELHATVAERKRDILVLQETLEEKDRTLAERDERIAALHESAAERRREITVLVGKVEESNRLLAERHGEIMALVGKVEDLWNSRSWRLTRPLRGARLLLARGAGHVRAAGRRPGEGVRLARKFWFHARIHGLGSALRRARSAIGTRWPAAAAAAFPAVPATPPPEPTLPAAAAVPAPLPEQGAPRPPAAKLPEPTLPAAPAPLSEKHAPCPPVAMLVRDFHAGGLEKVVIDLAKQFLGLGIVCPILVAGSGGRAAKLAEELGCDVRAFGGDVEKLVATVGEEGIEVVVTHHCYEPLEALSNAGVKVVEVIHNAYSWQRGLPFFSDLRDRHIDRFVAVSDFVRDYALTALSVPSDRIRVIENGLSRYGLIRPVLRRLTARRTTTADRPLLVCLANAHPQKNHVAILQAFERVVPDHPGASLVLAGEVDDTTGTGRRVLREIESRHPNGRVQRPGPLDRRALSRLLADAHVGLLPSVFEGFSIASLEYTYFALPAVLSDTGAARRLRDRYGHAVIAEAAALPSERLEPATVERRAFDPDPAAVTGIEGAIRTVLADYPQFAESAHRAGMDWERYSIESVADRYRDQLVEVAA